MHNLPEFELFLLTFHIPHLYFSFGQLQSLYWLHSKLLAANIGQTMEHERPKKLQVPINGSHATVPSYKLFNAVQAKLTMGHKCLVDIKFEIGQYIHVMNRLVDMVTLRTKHKTGFYNRFYVPQSEFYGRNEL